MHGKAYKSHILTKKSTKRLRGLRQVGYIAACEEKKVREHYSRIIKGGYAKWPGVKGQSMPLKSAVRF